MAKYSYSAPPSAKEKKKDDNNDDFVQERMPLCVGICVLLAIVFVLSRTGDDVITKGKQQQQQQNANIRSVSSAAPVPPSAYATITPATSAIPATTTTTTGTTTTTASYTSYNAAYATQNPIPETTTTTYSAAAAAGYATQNPIPQQQQTTTSTYNVAAGYATQNPVLQQQQQKQTTTQVYPTIPEQQPNYMTGTTTTTTTTKPDCDCPTPPTTTNDNDLMAQLRAKALAATTPHIIECSAAERGESQAACHLPASDRYAALEQKGATLWMTGCSGAGKTTIATALEERLVKHYGKHVYRLDGDNLRTGLNRDLGFSSSDRAESVRRTGELATLFSDAGVITLVGLISPYRADRDAVRKRHEEQGIPFYEVFLDVPVDELKKRDPKGQYAKVESGELKHFTCIDDPYEEPLQPEVTLKTHELTIEQSANILFRTLERDGILMGAPKVTPPGLPNPDGDEIVDLHVPPELQAERYAEAETLPKVLITDIDLNWLQTIGEGWASPLKGFMREGTLLETLHFNSILVDPFNLTANQGRLERPTDFNNFPNHPPPTRVSMSLPITLSCTSYTKDAIEGHSAVTLVTQMGQMVAILRNPEVYHNRKEEIVTRMYGVIDPGHPYIENIYKGGPYLIGGEVELLDRIRYNDGLDQWRKTAKELMAEFQQKGADTVYAFQTRNPTHAGHAYLMRSAGEDLRKQGYQKPVLWLSPLGGWTKSDDVPLDVRVKQHEQVLEAGLTHPGGLDPETTVMAIWPAPMVYAGPTEVQFHAKSRRSAGASYFVVGRDPAGMKGSALAEASPDDDLYDGNHGRYVLQNSPGIGNMQMLSFVKVMYDVTDNVMKVPDASRPDDFISISGTKMRLLARNGATPCSPTNIPTDLVQANCIPSGFMVPRGWDGVVEYYKHASESERWIPWSRPLLPAPAHERTVSEGRFGGTSFRLHHREYDSFWHDVPMKPTFANPALNNNNEPAMINFITEIPQMVTAKMEVSKERSHNIIMQDRNKDGSPRYYTYGTPFFNYGLISQTWEDPNVLSAKGHAGDNDPLDVIELGKFRLSMGSITPCRVLGSLELIDEGETDHKVLCLNVNDPKFGSVTTMDDLEQAYPGTLDRLIDWLTRYKTSDGNKPENSLDDTIPKSVVQTLAIIEETHLRWKALCGLDGTPLSALHSSAMDFWLDSPNCRGRGRRTPTT